MAIFQDSRWVATSLALALLACGGNSSGNGGTSSGGGAGSDCSDIVHGALDLIAYEGIVDNGQGTVQNWLSSDGSYEAFQDLPEARPLVTTDSPTGTFVATFDGVDDHLLLSAGFADFSAGFTAFVVAKTEATVPIQAPRFFDLAPSYGSLADSILFARFNEGGRDLIFQTYSGESPGPYVLAENAVVDDEWHIYTVIAQCGLPQTPTRADLYLDGDHAAVGSVHVPASLLRSSNFIGRSNLPQDSYFKGSIGEISIYRGPISDNTRAAKEADMRARWGLPDP